MFPQIEKMHACLSSLPGVSQVDCSVQSLQGISAEDLSLPAYATLPIGALRRTEGGLDEEALIQFEFDIEPTAQGWKTLEFLAWFVRDQSRGGVPLQLRPFALPPQGAQTLRWQIDLFCPNTGESLAPQLAQVANITKGLKLAAKIYAAALAA